MVRRSPRKRTSARLSEDSSLPKPTIPQPQPPQLRRSPRKRTTSSPPLPSSTSSSLRRSKRKRKSTKSPSSSPSPSHSSLPKRKRRRGRSVGVSQRKSKSKGRKVGGSAKKKEKKKVAEVKKEPARRRKKPARKKKEPAKRRVSKSKKKDTKRTKQKQQLRTKAKQKRVGKGKRRRSNAEEIHEASSGNDEEWADSDEVGFGLSGESLSEEDSGGEAEGSSSSMGLLDSDGDDKSGAETEESEKKFRHVQKMKCDRCGKVLNSVLAYRYHTANNVCWKQKLRREERLATKARRKKVYPRKPKAPPQPFLTPEEGEEGSQQDDTSQTKPKVSRTRRNRRFRTRLHRPESTASKAGTWHWGLTEDELVENIQLPEVSVKSSKSSVELGEKARVSLKYTLRPAESPDEKLLLEQWQPAGSYEAIDGETVSQLAKEGEGIALRPRLKETLTCELLYGEQPRPFGRKGDGPATTVPVFTAKREETDWFLNCSKAVTALEFAPTGSESQVAHLAIGTNAVANARHVFGELDSAPSPNELQLWRIEDEKCELAYCIKLSSGSILSLSWCPSTQIAAVRNKGCIGLLGCISSAGRVDVFCMPDTDDRSVVYDAKVLSLFHFDHDKVQPTCIEWALAFPHTFLVSGRSNGSLAVWNLEYSSPESTLPSCQVLNPESTTLVLDQLGSTHAGAEAAVVDVSSSPTSLDHVACISADSTVRVWNVRRPDAPVFSMYVGTWGKFTSIAWPAGVDYLIVCDDVGFVKWIQLEDGLIRQVKLHYGAIGQCRVNAKLNPPACLSCGYDGIVFLWRMPNYAKRRLSEDGKVDLLEVSQLGEWSKHRKKPYFAGFIEALPVELLQLDAEEHMSHSEESETKTVLYAGNSPQFPYELCLPIIDPPHVFSERQNLRKQLHISCVAWGEYPGSGGKQQYMAWGTKGNLARVRRIQVPIKAESEGIKK